MTTYDRLVKVFTSVFGDEINLDNISEKATLREDLGMNSIGMLYMAMALEEEFQIKFSNDDFKDLHTVKDVLCLLEGRV